MDLKKHLEFFDPSEDLDTPIHVIGCGAIGSVLLEMLVRLGIQQIHIYDFDKVEPANITNQMYLYKQVGQYKENAITEILDMINPDLKITAHGKYVNQNLTGYIFLCVDNIDLRREIVEKNFNNPYIKAFFDFRMRLTDAQHYAASWNIDRETKTKFLDTMQFTHEEAKEATPISACGTTLSIAPTIRVIVSYGVTNFINHLKGKPLREMILIDSFHFMLDCF